MLKPNIVNSWPKSRRRTKMKWIHLTSTSSYWIYAQELSGICQTSAAQKHKRGVVSALSLWRDGICTTTVIQDTVTFLIEEKAIRLKIINTWEKYKCRAVRKQKKKWFPAWAQESLECLAFVWGLQVCCDYWQVEKG